VRLLVAGAVGPGGSACMALLGGLLMREHWPASSAWSAWPRSGRRGKRSCGTDLCLERVGLVSQATCQALRVLLAWAFDQVR